MTDVSVISLPGIAFVDGAPQGSSPCERVDAYRRFFSKQQNKAVLVREVDYIDAGGGQITVDSRVTMFGGAEGSVAIGIRYRPKVFDLISMPWRHDVCREFRTTTDSSGTTRVLPSF